MTRTRKTAKDAGTRFAQSIADYLATHIDDRIERRTNRGAKDRGDISGLRVMGSRVVVECKDYGGQQKPGPWLGQAEIERGNDDAMVGIVISKRRGYGKAADQLVMMTVADLVALLTGEKPPVEAPVIVPETDPWAVE